MSTLSPDWREQLDERMRKDLAFTEVYVRDFNHGAVGHNLYLLIDRLALLLDVAAGIRDMPPPPDPADIVLTFGKHNNKSLGEIMRIDRGYVEWLAREGRDQTIRMAAQALLAPKESDEPPTDEDLPF